MLDLAALKHLIEVTFNKVCGLLAWKKIHWATIILHFNILIVTYKETLHCEFEYVLLAADRAVNLARCDVEVLLVRDRCLLDLLHNTVLTHTVATVKHSG